MFMRHDEVSDCILVSYSDVNASELDYFFFYILIFYDNISKRSYDNPNQLAQTDVTEIAFLLHEGINTLTSYSRTPYIKRCALCI